MAEVGVEGQTEDSMGMRRRWRWRRRRGGGGEDAEALSVIRTWLKTEKATTTTRGAKFADVGRMNCWIQMKPKEY